MNKKMLITGSTKRDGKALALAFPEYDKVLHYNTSSQEALELQKELDSKTLCLQADLTDEEAVTSLFETVKEKWGSIDVLINSASNFIPSSFETMNDFNTIFDLNFKAPILCAQKASTILREGGSIININDISVKRAIPRYFVHSLSKGALSHATKALSQVLAPKIRVNEIILGYTLKNEGVSLEKWEELYTKHSLTKRPCSLKELVAAVKFLIENTYITGESLSLDGGFC